MTRLLAATAAVFALPLVAVRVRAALAWTFDRADRDVCRWVELTGEDDDR